MFFYLPMGSISLCSKTKWEQDNSPLDNCPPDNYPPPTNSPQDNSLLGQLPPMPITPKTITPWTVTPYAKCTLDNSAHHSIADLPEASWLI